MKFEVYGEKEGAQTASSWRLHLLQRSMRKIQQMSCHSWPEFQANIKNKSEHAVWWAIYVIVKQLWFSYQHMNHEPQLSSQIHHL